MPGMYEGEDYDVAGFCVGVVEKEDVIDGSKVAAGDALIAVGSSVLTQTAIHSFVRFSKYQARIKTKS